ncbi:MAG: thioredoxin family protein [Bacteroidota bacterium]
MKTLMYPILGFVILLMTGFAPASSPVTSADFIDFYGKDQNESLDALIATVLENEKTPVLYFSATWCGPCKRFKKSLVDAKMIEALQEATLIMVDVDKAMRDNNEVNSGLTKRFGITSIPTFIKIDQKLNMLAKVGGEAWEEDIPENMAPVMKEFLNGTKFNR